MGTVPYYYRTEKRKEGGRGTAASKITYRTFFFPPPTLSEFACSPTFSGRCLVSLLLPPRPPENRKKYSNEAKRSVCGKWRQFSYSPPFPPLSTTKTPKHNTNGRRRGREEEGDYATSGKRKNCLWFSGGRERQRPFRRRSFSAAP